jgi:hypothetical protein
MIPLKNTKSGLEDLKRSDKNINAMDKTITSTVVKADNAKKNVFFNPVELVKGIVGLNTSTLHHYSSKEIVFSFNKVNNLYPLLTKTEYLLKSLFRSIFSLISKPIYLIRHDKVIIRLFVFISPKVDKFLDTSTLFKDSKLQGTNISIFADKDSGGKRKFLKFKSLRPNISDILSSQMNLTPKAFLNLNTVANNVLYKKDSRISLKEELNGDNTVESVHYPYSSFASTFNKKLEVLNIIFSKIFKKKVEFEIVKTQLPFQDSNILAQIIGYSANKYKFRRMLKILIPRAVIKNPSKELIPTTSYPKLASLNLSTNYSVQNSP